VKKSVGSGLARYFNAIIPKSKIGYWENHVFESMCWCALLSVLSRIRQVFMGHIIKYANISSFLNSVATSF
jgi:hypothetical protein